MRGTKTGLVVGFILGAAIVAMPSCEFLERGGLTPEQAVAFDDLTQRVQTIDEQIPAAQGQLDQFEQALAQLRAAGADSAILATFEEAVHGLNQFITDSAEERPAVMQTLTAINETAIQPDGSIDWGAAASSAAPLIAMIPGANFIVPMLPIIGGAFGWLFRNKKVKEGRIELAANQRMSQDLSVGTIGIIDSVQAIKKHYSADSEVGQIIRMFLSRQPQQSQFVVSAIRGNGFAGERMAPVLAAAQGELANQQRRVA